MNTIRRPNSIVQPASTKPTQFKKPSSANVPETVRSVNQPFTQVKLNIGTGVKVALQPRDTVQTKKFRSSVVKEPLLSTFELLDFFKIPFAAFNLENKDTESSASVF